MNRFIWVVLFLCLLTFSVTAEEFKAHTIKGNQALVEEAATGKKMMVKVGDELKDGWKVSEITPLHVTLDKDFGTHKIKKLVPVMDSNLRQIKK